MTDAAAGNDYPRTLIGEGPDGSPLVMFMGATRRGKTRIGSDGQPAWSHVFDTDHVETEADSSGPAYSTDEMRRAIEKEQNDG